MWALLADATAPHKVANSSRILVEKHAAELKPEAQRYLVLVRDNVRQMGSLIDDLLSFSRLGRQGLRKEVLQPAHLVHEVLGDLAADRLGRCVEILVGPLLPCLADAALLKQVFTNLLSNAHKFTRQRAVAHIEVGCREVRIAEISFVVDHKLRRHRRHNACPATRPATTPGLSRRLGRSWVRPP